MKLRKKGLAKTPKRMPAPSVTHNIPPYFSKMWIDNRHILANILFLVNWGNVAVNPLEKSVIAEKAWYLLEIAVSQPSESSVQREACETCRFYGKPRRLSVFRPLPYRPSVRTPLKGLGKVRTVRFPPPRPICAISPQKPRLRGRVSPRIIARFTPRRIRYGNDAAKCEDYDGQNMYLVFKFAILFDIGKPLSKG